MITRLFASWKIFLRGKKRKKAARRPVSANPSTLEVNKFPRSLYKICRRDLGEVVVKSPKRNAFRLRVKRVERAIPCPWLDRTLMVIMTGTQSFHFQRRRLNLARFSSPPFFSQRYPIFSILLHWCINFLTLGFLSFSWPS